VVAEYETFDSTLALDNVYAILGVAIVSGQVSEVVEVNCNLSIHDLLEHLLTLD
jgi:hypothetical protein